MTALPAPGAVSVAGQITGGDFGSIGTLTLAGGGARMITGTYLFDVNYGTAATGDETGDLLNITGASSMDLTGATFQLGAQLNAANLPKVGTNYAIKIFDCGATSPTGTPTFAGLAANQTVVCWGNAYYLVPEPASFALLAMGSLLLLRRPTRRRGR